MRAWPAAVPALATAASVPAGLGLTAFTLGLRHGLDWDHLAAIADLGVAQRSRRRAIGVASLYIAGHAAVVLLFGGLGLFFATRLPADVDDVMERVVGATLLLLGAYVVAGLLRHGRDFRLRSRWSLAAHVAQRVRQRLRRDKVVVIEHEHRVDESHDHDDARVHAYMPASRGTGSRPVHSHRHRHVASLPEDPVPSGTTAVVVGGLHGVGAETPTQLGALTAAAGIGGATGALVLGCFLAGLVISNTAVALSLHAAPFALARGTRRYVIVSAVSGVLGLAVGTALVIGASFPALAGG